MTLAHSQWFLLVFVTLLILIVIIPKVQAQQCMTFDPSAAPASGDVCPPYLSSQVWLPLIANPISVVDNALNSSVLWEIKAVHSILSIDCYDALLSLLCNAAFPPCNYSMSPSIPVAYSACRSACMHVNDVCSYFFELYGQTPINCSQSDVITGEDQWPVEYRDNNFLGLIHVNTSCLPTLPTAKPTVANGTQECPYPLARVDHIDYSKPPCFIPCPDPTWTPKQWHDIAIVDFSFALLSTILMALISIHYLADPKCRNTTKRFQLYSYLSQMLFAFSFVVGGPDPMRSTWCADSTTFAEVDKPRCGAQAFFFVVFGLSSSIWWAISSSIMYIQLTTRMYRISKKRELLYYLIGFGFPIIPFIIAVQQDVVSFYWLTPFCFVQYLIHGTKLDYHYILFYIPLCVPVIVALGYIIATIYTIIKHTKDMKVTFKGQERSGGIDLVKVNIRLFIWCASLFLFFFTILIYRFALEAKWQNLETDAYSWGVCKVRYELGVGPDTECPESKYPRPINYPGTMIHYIVCTSLGTLSFLSFATTKNIYYFWYFAWRLVYTRSWPELRELFTNEKAFAAMRLRDIRKSAQQVQMENLGVGEIPQKTPHTSTTDNLSVDLDQHTSEKSDVDLSQEPIV